MKACASKLYQKYLEETKAHVLHNKRCFAIRSGHAQDWVD